MAVVSLYYCPLCGSHVLWTNSPAMISELSILNNCDRLKYEMEPYNCRWKSRQQQSKLWTANCHKLLQVKWMTPLYDFINIKSSSPYSPLYKNTYIYISQAESKADAPMHQTWPKKAKSASDIKIILTLYIAKMRCNTIYIMLPYFMKTNC